MIDLEMAGRILAIVALAGDGLLLCAALLVGLRARRSDKPEQRGDAPAISVLKPLHGPEPQLRANLASTLEQDYAGAAELICGVSRADDPAAAEVLAIAAAGPAIPVRLVVSPRGSGANAKIGNLAAIAAQARHEVLVMADSDMAVPSDYLTQLAESLSRPGVGAVTCLYLGRGDSGMWSRFVAAGIDTHFFPSVLLGQAARLANPCMGSTIALTRQTLNNAGGFERFADVLADDHAIGAAVRAQGLHVVLPAMTLTHACRETRLTQLLRQELRWNATLRGIDPLGYAGSIVLHPLPIALIALLAGGGMLAGVAAGVALAARAVIAIGTACTLAPARAGLDRWLPLLLIPARDLLSFGIFVLAFTVRSVDWRDARFHLEREGRIAAPKEDPA